MEVRRRKGCNMGRGGTRLVVCCGWSLWYGLLRARGEVRGGAPDPKNIMFLFYLLYKFIIMLI